FATSMASLAMDRSESVVDTSATDPNALRALIDSIRVAESAAGRCSRAKRYRDVNGVRIEIERLNQKLVSGELVARFDAEQFDLEQLVYSLATSGMINRVTLGSTRVRVDSLKGALAQLGDEMRLTRAFQLLLTRLDDRVAGLAEGDGQYHAELGALVQTALEKLIEGSRSDASRTNMLALRPEMDHALLLADSVESLLLFNRRDAAGALLSGPLDDFIDGT